MTSSEWDKYWSEQRSSIFGIFAETYRLLFLSMPLRTAFEKYFPKKGTFLEAGCGSAQDTQILAKHRRKLIGLDYSRNAVRLAGKQKNIDKAIAGDILKLEFKEKTFDGIWNLGVMEHFTKKDIDKILSGFHRILKSKGRLILFWPARWNIANKIFPNMFPAMPSLLKSKAEAKKILTKKRFAVISIKATLVGDYIIVAEKM
jgi:SAM-dependent methyltransferase